MAGLFDRVVVGLTNGVNTVTEGSKQVVAKAQINTRIQQIERERNDIATSMGNLIYNLTLSGEIHIEQCDAMCVEIKNCNDKIAELQAELKALEAQRTPAAAPVYTAPADGVRCGNCGFVNKSTAKFCAGCGSPMNN